MNRTRYMLMLLMVMLSGLVGGALCGRLSAVVPTQAQQVERVKAAGPTKWEYCALTRAIVGPGRGGLYWISYFREGGSQVVEVEELATERSGAGKAISKLGEDGWELVGQGPLEIRQGNLTALYFKRPKP